MIQPARTTRLIRKTAWLLVLASAATPRSNVARAEDDRVAPITAFAVRAKLEPAPALRYRLLPPFADLTPGNAAILYTKISVGYQAQRSHEAYELDNKIIDWMDLPLDKLPRAEVERVVNDNASRWRRPIAPHAWKRATGNCRSAARNPGKSICPRRKAFVTSPGCSCFGAVGNRRSPVRRGYSHATNRPGHGEARC